MNYIKMVIENNTLRLRLGIYEFDTEEGRLDQVRYYPVIEDKELLKKIICEDVEVIHLRYFRRVVKLWEDSSQRQYVEYFIDNLTLDTDSNRKPSDPLEIYPVSYYTRRYIKQQTMILKKRDRKYLGMAVPCTLKNLFDICKNVPSKFKLIQKEMKLVCEQFKHLYKISEWIDVVLLGDMVYTKQFVTEHLIEEKDSMAPYYMIANFFKDDSLINIEGEYTYPPFVDRIVDMESEVISTDRSSVLNYLFGMRDNRLDVISPISSLYVFSSGEMIVSNLEEERYFLNEDRTIYSKLPKSFLVDGNVVIKSSELTGEKFVGASFIEQDFLLNGESLWRMELSTEGFVLPTVNLFSIDLYYIQENMKPEYLSHNTIRHISTLSNPKSVKLYLSRMAPDIEKIESLSKIVDAMINSEIDEKVYRSLYLGLKQEYGKLQGMNSIFSIMQSSLFGISRI